MFTIKTNDGIVFHDKNEWDEHLRMLARDYLYTSWYPESYPCLAVKVGVIPNDSEAPDNVIYTFFYDFKEN